MTAPTIDVPILEGDDVGFVHAVRDELTTMREVYLVKVDHGSAANGSRSQARR